MDSKQPQWQAFRKRLGQPHVPEAFSEVVAAVLEFLAPVIEKTAADLVQKIWHPPGPWSRQVDG